MRGTGCALLCWLSSYRPGASGRTHNLYWSQSLPCALENGARRHFPGIQQTFRRTHNLYWSQSLPCAPENGARHHFPSFLLWRQRLRVPPGAGTASKGWRSGRKRPSDSEKTPLSGTARGHSSFRTSGKQTMDARRNAPHFRARHFSVLAIFLHRVLSYSHTAVSTACAYTISCRNCRRSLQVTIKHTPCVAWGVLYCVGCLPAQDFKSFAYGSLHRLCLYNFVPKL